MNPSAFDLTLRGERAKREDVRLGPTTYTRSGSFQGPIDPSTRAQSVLVQRYLGTNWPGLASAGISASVTMGPPIAAPTVGTDLRGFTSAEFQSASTQSLSTGGTGGTGQVLSDLFTTSRGGGFAVIEPTALVADPGATLRYNAPAIFDDSGGTYWFITAWDGGVTFGATAEGVGVECTALGFAVGNRYFVQWAFDTDALYLRINNGDWSVVEAAGVDIAGLGSFLRMGAGFGGYLDAKIWAACVTPDALSSDVFAGYGLWYQRLLGVDFGFVETGSGAGVVASSAIDVTLGGDFGYADIFLYPDLDYVAPALAVDFFGFTIFQDSVWRPAVDAGRQHAFASNVAPVAAPTLPLGHDLAAHPDTIGRVSAAQPSQTFALDPRPQPPWTRPHLRWFQDQVDMVRMPAAAQMATYLDPRPQPPWTRPHLRWFQDSVARVTFPTGAQQAVAFAPFPDTRTSQWSDVIAPPAIARMLGAPEPGAVRPPDQPAAAPTVTFFDAEMPPAVARGGAPAWLLPWDASPPARPEQAAARSADTFHPDAVNRLVFGAMLQQAFATSPKPERARPFTDAVVPEAVRRPVLAASAQLAATELPPKPERTAPLAVEVHPDRLDRPAMHASTQLAASEVPPLTDRNVVAVFVSYADGVVRAKLPEASHQAFAFVRDPGVAPAAPTAFAGWFPERAARATFHASAQLAATELPPKPDLSLVRGAAYHPDAIATPSGAASRAPAFATSALPIPAVTTPTFWAGSYPDRIPRALVGAAQAQAFALAPKPERTSPVAAVVFPERVWRPMPEPARAQAFASSSLVVPTIARVEMPVMQRPAIPRAYHTGTFALPSKPERKSVFVALAEVDGVDRRSGHAARAPWLGPELTATLPPPSFFPFDSDVVVDIARGPLWPIFTDPGWVVPFGAAAPQAQFCTVRVTAEPGVVDGLPEPATVILTAEAGIAGGLPPRSQVIVTTEE